jgi:uncharacterized protein YggE
LYAVKFPPRNQHIIPDLYIYIDYFATYYRPGDLIKTESMLFLIAVFAIFVMGSLIGLGILYPSGLSQNSGETYITVSATGSAQAAPQLATLSVLMNGTGSSPAIATSNLSLTLTQFNYSISPYIESNSSRITAQSYSVYKYNTSRYVATESVSVSLPNVLNTSSILGSLSQINGVYIHGVNTQFSREQFNILSQQALSAAMVNATAQAAVLAPNKTLSVRNITISSSYTYPYSFLANTAGASKSPIFFSGIEAVTKTVTVVFSYR